MGTAPKNTVRTGNTVSFLLFRYSLSIIGSLYNAIFVVHNFGKIWLRILKTNGRDLAQQRSSSCGHLNHPPMFIYLPLKIRLLSSVALSLMCASDQPILTLVTLSLITICDTRPLWWFRLMSAWASVSGHSLFCLGYVQYSNFVFYVDFISMPHSFISCFTHTFWLFLTCLIYFNSYLSS